MMRRMKSVLRDILPPVVTRSLTRRQPVIDGRIKLGPAYGDWKSASQASSGYDAAAILQAVDAATQRVVHGHAALERDGVTFNEAAPPLPLIAGLLRAATESTHGLRVLDFGGSLGSSWRQCEDFLTGVDPVEWRVVEQSAFVALGREKYETPKLRFFEGISEAVKSWQPDTVLISAALHYIEEPRALLAEVASLGSRYLIIDRTPLTPLAEDIVVVQEVPASIYPASYPCWLFSRSSLLAQLQQDWELLASFPALDGVFDANGVAASFTGMILRRLPAARSMG